MTFAFTRGKIKASLKKLSLNFFIPDCTVGFGFSPNQLQKQVTGLSVKLNYRRLGLAPDPEVCVHIEHFLV